MPAPGAPTADSLRTWLTTAQRQGVQRQEALRLFDHLPEVPLAALQGPWRGVGIPTGHPLDGMLEAFGWYGKAFDDSETVFPLLFRDEAAGKPFAIDPKHLPLRLAARLRLQRSRAAQAAFRAARVALRTTRPTARLRLMAYRGKTSAAMLYDSLPIHDVFRQVDADCVLGLMDCRYFEVPLFFTLYRA